MKFNTIVGQAARGNDFFPRPEITNEITDKLNSGSNLLLVAPRRVGKTSLLMHFLDNPPEDTIVIYYISQSVNNENEFYRKLFNHIIERISRIEKYKKILFTGAKQIYKSIKAIGKDGIELDHDASIDYYNEVTNLLKNLKIDEKLIVLIDEFAETIENIMRDENEGNAIHLLETTRELRQIPETHKKVQFIYAGSIGLENVAEKLASIKHINDIVPVQIPPLTSEKAKELIKIITANSGVEFPEESIKYMFDMIEWLIPFYFELLLDEIAKVLTETETNIIINSSLDTAVKRILKQNIYFQNWFGRLRRVFEGQDFSFIKTVLNTLSENKQLTSAEITDFAHRYKLSDTYNNLMNTLKHDGYINNDDDPKIYRFNSPLLREWWYRNVAN